MEKIVEQGLLYDFYGEILTEKQRELFDLYYNEDLSLSEIADQIGISRQGVRDLIKKAEEELLFLEEKLGLARKMVSLRQHSDNMVNIAKNTELPLEISIKSNKEAHVLTIADTGIGMSREEMEAAIKAHNEDPDAHAGLLKFVIGDTEPENGPVLWFDTSQPQENPEVLMLNIGPVDEGTTVFAEIGGEEYAVDNIGVNTDPTDGRYSIGIID